MPRQVTRRTAAPARPAAARGRAAPADQEVASLRYGDMVPGGLIDDVNAIIVAATFRLWDYGKGEVEKVFLHLTLKADDDEAEYEQYYSAADPDDWVPNDSGISLVRPDGSESTKPLNNNTNFAQLMASIENAGFPPEMLEGNDISVLDGLYGHWRREIQERKGLKRADDSQPLTVLLLDNLISMPGEAPKASSRAPAARKPAPPTRAAAPTSGSGAPSAVAADDDLANQAITVILAQLEKEGPTPRSKLTGLFFKAFKQDANRKDLLALAADEAWVIAMAAEGYWTYEDGTLVPA